MNKGHAAAGHYRVWRLPVVGPPPQGMPIVWVEAVGDVDAKPAALIKELLASGWLVEQARLMYRAPTGDWMEIICRGVWGKHAWHVTTLEPETSAQVRADLKSDRSARVAQKERDRRIAADRLRYEQSTE